MTVNCGKDVYLRELSQDDYYPILRIVRACAAHSTRILYELHKDRRYNHIFHHNIEDVFDECFLSKLLENFKHFEYLLRIRGTTEIPEYKEFLKDMEKAFEFFPDGQLFLPYGPIQPPLEDSVKEFLGDAIEAQNKIKDKPRRMFRMGIMQIDATKKEDTLIGCFTIDFDEHKILGYPDITTGDPGIFIVPDHRDNKDKDMRNWETVFILATKIVEEYFKFDENVMLISATTHRFNVEAENILKKGFKEHDSLVTHAKFGVRRFFTISKEHFIANYRKGMPDYQVIITE